MALIYSRPRIKLPRLFIINNRNNRNKSKKIFKILFIMIVVFIIFIVISKAVTPVFNRLCSDRAKSIATIIINDETTNAIKEYEYSDFIIIHKDKDGNISMVESNIKNVNIVTSDAASRIQTSINNTKEENINISLGSFTGISILSGRGIKIPIVISTIGNVKTSIKSEFVSQGINQTLHRLYLEIESQISVLTPFNTINESVSNQLIIAENIIVGQIPDSYYNIEGVSQSDAMNLIQ